MEYVVEILVGVIALWMGSIEWRIRSMYEKLSKLPSKEDLDHDIELHQESIKVMQRELKEDVVRIEKKLDILIQQNTKD